MIVIFLFFVTIHDPKNDNKTETAVKFSLAAFKSAVWGVRDYHTKQAGIRGGILRLRRSKIRPMHWASSAPPQAGNGQGGSNALTFNPDHLMGADHIEVGISIRVDVSLKVW